MNASEIKDSEDIVNGVGIPKKTMEWRIIELSSLLLGAKECVVVSST